MKLVINKGGSSLKFALFNTRGQKIFYGKIRCEHNIYTITYIYQNKEESKSQKLPMKNQIAFLLRLMTRTRVIRKIDEID
ncbi:hypothetical protein [Ureaplasma canigenitalium]|uniref:hypothetical protein n=1 Tax=Ureaplasma canigenitalium TaxID=42092 RepID=UPI0004E0CC3F|nr:hypothetical protein [Ureaplasma canigenitalium]